MRIRTLTVSNFRALENLQLSFGSNYTAICGKNNCGKSSVFAAILSIIGPQRRPFEYGRLLQQRDVTAWKKEGTTDSSINVSATLELDGNQDRGLFAFLAKFAEDVSGKDSLSLEITKKIEIKDDSQDVSVKVGGAVLDAFSSNEVARRLQTPQSCLLHNSALLGYFHGDDAGSVQDLLLGLSQEHHRKLDEKKRAFTNELKRILEAHRQEFRELLGRLGDRYEVSLSVPDYTFEELPYAISLGDKDYNLPLTAWGSGTRNRTRLLRLMFDAKKAIEAKELSDRITPVLLVEEPESFLHPSAQAQFGMVLQDLAREFQLQIIVSTHSPYMLSSGDVAENILLSRRIQRRKVKSGYAVKQRETEVVATDGADWRRPFEHALGVSGSELDYLKTIIFSRVREIVLVEGSTDVEYLRLALLLDEGDRLDLRGEIFDYGGVSKLKNGSLINFIANRHPVVVVTSDLDAKTDVLGCMKGAGIDSADRYLSLGVDRAGYRDIEGLLPERIKSDVNASNPDLVNAVRAGTTDERNNAKSLLKRAYLDYFRENADPERGEYDWVKAVARDLNKLIQRQRGALSERLLV